MRRRLTLAMLLICFATALGGAQLAPPSHSMLFDPQQFAEAHLRGLDREMHLSDQQKEKIRPIFLAEGRELILILKDPRLSQEQRREFIRNLHQVTAAKVFSMLTPEQRRRNQRPSKPRPSAQPNAPAMI